MVQQRLEEMSQMLASVKSKVQGGMPVDPWQFSHVERMYDDLEEVDGSLKADSMSAAEPEMHSETIVLKAGGANVSGVKELTKALLTYGAKAAPQLMPDLDVDSSEVGKVKSLVSEIAASKSVPLSFIGKSKAELKALPNPKEEPSADLSSTFAGTNADKLVEQATQLA